MQGTLHLLILRTPLRGPVHGHAIAKAIEFDSDDVLQFEQGSLVLVGAGLMVRTLKNLRSVDVGFDSHNL